MSETITIRTSSERDIIKIVERGPQGASSGGGTGSVTSVALAGTGLSITGSPVTSSGTITANVVFGTTAGTACEGNDGRIAYIASGKIDQRISGFGSIGTINMTAGDGISGSINTSDGGGDAAGGTINTSGHISGSFGGSINTSAGVDLNGGSLDLSQGGGSINTRGTGSIQFGEVGTRTTLTGTATADRAISLPNAAGTLALTSDLTKTAVGLGNVTNAAQVTSVTGTAPIVSSGGTTPAISVTVGTTAGSVAAGDDSRITGAAQKASNLSDLASASTARTNLGLGTAATAASGDFAAASHTHPASAISDSTTAGRALLTAADAAAQRTSLGLGTLATQSGTFSGTSSGTNTGDQTISLTGDVTGSGTGSFAATIANNAVTNAKLAQVATSTIKGRATAATGNVEDLTATQVRTVLGLATTDSPSFASLTVTSSGITVNNGSFITNAFPVLRHAGTEMLAFATNSQVHINVNGAYSIGWATSAPTGSDSDCRMWRDAANTWALRNGTNAQESRLYGTFTSSTNYQRMTIKSVKQTLSALSGASATTTGTFIPDGAVVVGVTTRVATAITGATGYQVGDGTTATRWGDITGTAIGTTSDNVDWTVGTIECFTAGGNVTLTAKGSNFTAGAVEICVFYLAGQAD